MLKAATQPPVDTRPERFRSVVNYHLPPHPDELPSKLFAFRQRTDAGELRRWKRGRHPDEMRTAIWLRNLKGRREPAQAEAGRIGRAQQEGGLGLVVLHGQGLHPVGLGPGVEGLDHAGGIAAERPVGERVHLEQRVGGERLPDATGDVRCDACGSRYTVSATAVAITAWGSKT